mgnify:CR=1 FL=1
MSLISEGALRAADRAAEAGNTKARDMVTYFVGQGVGLVDSVRSAGQVVQDFKEGKKDVEEFWINMGGKMIHIRYFAVRDENGEFIGTLEVTQDITKIKELKGEKRLVE